MLGQLPPLGAATVSERESLRGLPGVVLKPIKFALTPPQMELGFPLFDLRKEIEGQLREAGILLEVPTFDGSSQRPFLEIRGAVTKIAANYYAYTIVVELHQEVTLLRNASRPSVVTWSVGTLSTGDLENFPERIRLLVRMFIKDFQKMNTEQSPAWSLSWSQSKS